MLLLSTWLQNIVPGYLLNSDLQLVSMVRNKGLHSLSSSIYIYIYGHRKTDRTVDLARQRARWDKGRRTEWWTQEDRENSEHKKTDRMVDAGRQGE